MSEHESMEWENTNHFSTLIHNLKSIIWIDEKPQEIHQEFYDWKLIIEVNDNIKVTLERESNNNINIKTQIVKNWETIKANIPPLYWVSKRSFEIWLQIVLKDITKDKISIPSEVIDSFDNLDKYYEKEKRKTKFSEAELNKQLEIFNSGLKLEDFPENTIWYDLTEAWVERYESQYYQWVLNSFLEMTSNWDLYTIMNECDNNNVPYEMAFLAIAESNWEQYKISKAWALWYWQIMDKTAKDIAAWENLVLDLIKKSGISDWDSESEKAEKLRKYFIDNTSEKDFRLDPEKSTKFSINFLKDRHQKVSINVINYKKINLSNSDSWYWTMYDYNGWWSRISNLPDSIKETNGNASMYWKYSDNFENVNYVARIIAIKKVIKSFISKKWWIEELKNEAKKWKWKETNDQSINIFWASKRIEYNWFKNNLDDFRLKEDPNNKGYFHLMPRIGKTGTNKIVLNYTWNENNIEAKLKQALNLWRGEFDLSKAEIKWKQIIINVEDFESFWNNKKKDIKPDMQTYSEEKSDEKRKIKEIKDIFMESFFKNNDLKNSKGRLINPEEGIKLLKYWTNILKKALIEVINEHTELQNIYYKENKEEFINNIVEQIQILAFKKYFNDIDKENSDIRIIQQDEAKELLKYWEARLKKILLKLISQKDSEWKYRISEILSRNTSFWWSNENPIKYSNDEELVNKLINKLKEIAKPSWAENKTNINTEYDQEVKEIIKKCNNNRISLVWYLKTVIKNWLSEELNVAKKANLTLYQNLSMIKNDIKSWKLVKVEWKNYQLDKNQIWEYYKDSSEKELNYYTLKKSKEILDEIWERFNKATGKKFNITSWLRSVDYQKDLRKGNWNWARWVSSHNYWIAFDITHVPMSNEELIKMALILRDMEKEWKLFALIEGKQQCFHIAINPNINKT